MRYLKNQFRGRIGRTILVKKSQKTSPFYFRTPIKPSVYAVFETFVKYNNRKNMNFGKKTSKNFSVTSQKLSKNSVK